MHVVRVLLSDGSGLTARQVATQLSTAGHVVEVLSPTRLALTGFTRHVRRVHPVPPYGAQPFAWLEAALEVYRAGRFDMLLPTQEQVAVLARSPGRLEDAGVITAVPPFEALRRVQDKVAARGTLDQLGLPQPDADVVTTASELAGWRHLPVYVKTPIGTATSGVRHVGERAEMEALAAAWEADGSFSHGGVLVQSPARGTLVMVQAVFCRGVLVADHANLRVREGVSGGASHKRSIHLPAVRAHLAALGSALDWHGALSLDAVVTDDGPRYIDVNPRLVEPGNAWRSGVDLVGALLESAGGHMPGVQPPGRVDVVTHQLLLAVLGAAQHRGTRRAVLAELRDAGLHRASYRGSTEELTPARRDLRTIIPVAAASLATLVRPAAWTAFSSAAVTNYALTPAGWRAILAGAPPSEPPARPAPP